MLKMFTMSFAFIASAGAAHADTQLQFQQGVYFVASSYAPDLSVQVFYEMATENGDGTVTVEKPYLLLPDGSVARLSMDKGTLDVFCSAFDTNRPVAFEGVAQSPLLGLFNFDSVVAGATETDGVRFYPGDYGGKTVRVTCAVSRPTYTF